MASKGSPCSGTESPEVHLVQQEHSDTQSEIGDSQNDYITQHDYIRYMGFTVDINMSTSSDEEDERDPDELPFSFIDDLPIYPSIDPDSSLEDNDILNMSI